MSRVIIGHFGDESLQSVTCTGTDKPEQPREWRQNTYKTQTNATHKMAVINNDTKHSENLG